MIVSSKFFDESGTDIRSRYGTAGYVFNDHRFVAVGACALMNPSLDAPS